MVLDFELNFYKLSDFELKVLQIEKFWCKNILN